VWLEEQHVVSVLALLDDTLISLYPFGEKKIEEIAFGDVVKSVDPETGEVSAGTVVLVKEHDPGAYLVINEQLKVTANHHMYVNDEWMEIGEAELGDYLLNENGDRAYIFIQWKK
jgi:hypothetical protein